MELKSRYRYDPLQDLLGKGGFARVYRATDTLLDRTVALKIFAGIQDKYGSVLQEIRRAIRLEHPNLCRYYDVVLLESQNPFGDTEITEVGVMEYLDGGSLGQYWRTADADTRHKLLLDVLRGLAYLHRNGIVHRDLKAQNVLIKLDHEGPVAKITDFGTSKAILEVGKSSVLMGTPEYMAPEQFSAAEYGIDGKISTNVDLWAFGIMLYKLFTGRSLFGLNGENTTGEVMKLILERDMKASLAQLPSPYREVATRCLVRKANERAQRAEELISLMQQSAPQENERPTVWVETRTQTRSPEIVIDEPDSGWEPRPKRITAPAPAKSTGMSNAWLVGVALVVVALGGWWLIKGVSGSSTQAVKKTDSTSNTAYNTVVSDLAKSSKPAPLNADSLFLATKTAFTEQGLDKQEAARQFKRAVAIKPGLAPQIYSLFSAKADKFKTLNPELSGQYRELAGQFKP